MLAMLSSDVPQHRASSEAARSFGTPLRSNVDRSKQRSAQTSTKKKVKVRRTPQPASATRSSSADASSTFSSSSSSSATKTKTKTKAKPRSSAAATPQLRPSSLFSSVVTRTANEKTVIFAPGPVGLQLEPVNEAPVYGCRVTRFVDGGPNDPGQARASGKIQPGDLVLKVEAQGMPTAATTYDEIIHLLTITHSTRIMTVQSVWDSSPREREPAESLQHFIQTKRASKRSGTNSNSNSNSAAATVQTSPDPLGPTDTTGDRTSPRSRLESDVIYQPPFQNVLSSLSYPDKSRSQSNTPIRQRTLLPEDGAENGPIIVPIKTAPTIASPRIHRSESSNSSFYSQDTTKSSNRSMQSPPRQALADQFLLFDGFMGSFEPESSQHSVETSSETDMDSNVDDTHETEPLDSRHVRTPEKNQQTEHSTEDDGHQRKESPSKAQIDHQQSLFEDTLARVDYEQRLQAARMEHSKAERELKDLYISTCERNETKIRELQVVNEDLRKALEETKTKHTLLTNTRIKELEQQVAETEKLRTQTKIEAKEQIQSKYNEYSRHMKAKEDQWRKRFATLEEENNELREESKSRGLELDMQRTMVAEMESRIIAAETEKAEISTRLERTSYSLQELEESMVLFKEDDKHKHGLLEITQRRLEEVSREKDALLEEIESYESFKEESSVLTEKLANSVHEKQKAVIESQSLASKLEAENDRLTKQIAESTNDVEQLLEEKLQLEDKLAVTWKDIEKARNDASTMHENLMEKLENGEYYTSVDIEEKELEIQSLTCELEVTREHSKDELIKSTKNTLNLHLQLRGAERNLHETEQSNLALSQERDEVRTRNIELEESLVDAESRVAKVAELYENEKASATQLVIEIEALQKAKGKADVHHQESIQALSSEMESKRMELSSCKVALEEMQSLKENAIATSEELKLELQTVTKSKEDAELQYQESIESLSLQIESKKSELSSYKGTLEEMQSQSERQSKLVSDLQSELETLTKSKKQSELRYEERVQSILTELEAKTRDLSSSEEKLQEMICQKESARAAGEELKTQLEALSKSKEEAELQYKEEIESVSADLSAIKMELSSSGDKLEEMKLQSEKRSAMASALQTQLDEMRKYKEESELLNKEQMKSFMEELEGKQNDLSSCESRLEELESLRKDAENNNAELRIRVEDLTKSNEENKLLHEEELKSISEELETKIKDLSLCRSKLEEMELQNEKQSRMTSDLQTQLDETTKYKEDSELEYKKDFESISAELKAKKTELSMCETRLEEMESLNEDAVKTIGEQKIQFESLLKLKEDSEIEREEEIESISAELEAKKTELLTCEARLEEMESMKEDAVKAIGELKVQVESLLKLKEDSKVEHKDEIESISAKLEAKTTELLSCEAKLEEMESTKEEDVKTIGELKAQVESLSKSNEDSEIEHKEEIEAISTKLEAKKKELSTCKARLEEMESMKEDTVKTNRELKVQVKSLLKLKEDSEIEHKEEIESILAELEAKTIELSTCEAKLEEMEPLKEDAVKTIEELKVQVKSLLKLKEASKIEHKQEVESISTELKAKKTELLSCEATLGKTVSEKERQLQMIADAESNLEAMEKAQRDAKLQHQKSVDTLSAELESKKIELLSCENKVATIQSLTDDAISASALLKIQLEALVNSKDESELRQQKTIESLSSELESKTKELSQEITQLKITENELEQKIMSLTDEKEEMVTKYEKEVEELGARLQTEGETLRLAKSTEKELLQNLLTLGTEREKEVKQSEGQIEHLTASLQSQYEEFSCIEMRMDILQEEYDSAKSALDEAKEKIDSLSQEKQDIEKIHQERIKQLDSELCSKQALLETTESNLKNSIEELTKVRNQNRKDIEELTNELDTTRSELSVAVKKLKEFEDRGVNLTSIEELKKTIDTLKSESESVSTQYWETIQELTADMQSQTQELARKQSILGDIEEEIQCNEIKIREMEQEIFQKDLIIGNLKTESAVQTKRLECSDAENWKHRDLISILQSKLNNLEDYSKDKIELQRSCDTLKKKVADLEKSKERLSIDSCSEIFRLVKRLALLDHTHSDIRDQRSKAMEIATMQRKWQKRAKIQVASLEKKLELTSERALQHENELRQNLSNQQQKDNLVAIELSDKMKEIEHQRLLVSSLQAEICAMHLLHKNLEDARQREICEFKVSSEKLEFALASEKIASTQSAEDAYDARMELKIMEKKYNSMTSTMENAQLKCTATLRSLFSANAIVASLSVQLKEKDRQLTDALCISEKYKNEIDYKLQEQLESRKLEEELVKKTKYVAELKSRLFEVEGYAMKAHESLGIAQQTERHLRRQFNEWKVSLHNEVAKIRRTHEESTTVANIGETGANLDVQDDEAKADMVYLSLITAEMNRLVNFNSALEMDLDEAEKEKLISDELLEKSMKTVNVLHQNVSDLREKLKAKDQDLDLLQEDLKSTEATAIRLKDDLEWTNKDHEEHIVELQQQVLSTRATFIADHFKMRNLELHVSNLRKNEIKDARRIAELQESNGQTHAEMEKMILIMTQKEQQYEQLEQEMKTLENTLVSNERKRNESGISQKTEGKDKARLLKNIEDLSMKLLSIEESQKQSDMFHKSVEESLKKSLSKIHAEFIVKHIEMNDLKKQIAVLNHSNKKAKKNAVELENAISKLENDIETSEVALSQSNSHSVELNKKIRSLEDERMQYQERMEFSLKQKVDEIASLEVRLVETNSNIEIQNVEMKSLEEKFVRKQNELESLLSKQTCEFDQLQKNTFELQNRLELSQRKIEDDELQRKSDQEELSALRSETDQLSTMLSILKMENTSLGESLKFSEQNNKDEEVARKSEQEKFSALRRETDQLSEKLMVVEKEKASVEESLENSQKKIQEEELARKSNQEECLALRHNVDQLSKKIVALEKLKVSLEESLEKSHRRIEEEELARKFDQDKYFALRSEAENLSSKLEILEKEKFEMSEIILRQQNQLHTEEEKFNEDIANELTRLRQKIQELEGENYTKSNTLAELQNSLESIQSRFSNLTTEKVELEERLRRANVELQRCREIAEERKNDIILSNTTRETLSRDFENLTEQLDMEKNSRLTDVGALHEKCAELEATNAALCERAEGAKETILSLENKLKSFDEVARSDPPMIEDGNRDHLSPVKDHVNRDHLSSVKDAFYKQAAVLEDVKISETMLEDLIKEVMAIATRSESEMLELSSTLGTVDDLLFHPSHLLASLDLAGVGSSEHFFGGVRSRLEDLAALAYTTSVELNNRQNRLTQWKSKRSESPSLPTTPPSSKQLSRTLFNANDAESNCDITPVVTDGAREVRDKLAGARLLSCILENHNKMDVASAFRKWTCAAGVISASSQATSQKEKAAAELAHELQVTREKLVVLKNHLKAGRVGKQKPRLRRILERLDGNNMKLEDDSNTNANGAFHIHMDDKDCSFGI